MRLPRWGLVRRDESFFDLFATIAGTVARGTVLLGEVLSASADERDGPVEALQDAERAADDAVHLVVRRLGSTFVPPFDRRDVYALAHCLDDCLDRVEGAAVLVQLYRLGPLPGPMFELVQVLQRQAELTVAAVPRLRSPKDLAEYWVETNRLQNQAAAVHRRLRASLAEDVADLRRLLRLRDVADELAAASTAFERVAQTVETIALGEP